MTKKPQNRDQRTDVEGATALLSARWWVAVGAIVVVVATLAGMLWWFAQRQTDPRTQAALIAGGTSLLVAAVGVLSTTTGASVGYRNAVRLFQRQLAEQQRTRFDEPRRVAYERLVGAARLHAFVAEKLDKSIRGGVDKTELDRQRAEEWLLRTELVQIWATVNLLAPNSNLRDKAAAVAMAGISGQSGKVQEHSGPFEAEARKALGIS